MSDLFVREFPEITPIEGMPSLGRHVVHDPRSRQYAFKADPVVSPLKTVHHNINIAPLDQGQVGSCVPNMGTAYLAWDGIYHTLPQDVKQSLNQDFALQWYREVTRIDPFAGSWEPDDTGSDGLSCAKVAVKRKHISGYVHTFDVMSALAALQKQPLGIGAVWTEGCYYPNRDGLVSYTGTPLGGHEFLAVGFDAERQWVEFRNSWGDGWGVKGHFYMTVVDFTRALRDDGDAIIFVPNTQPAPVPTVSEKFSAADQELIKSMDPWSSTIISRLTKAGKANQAYLNWKSKHTA